MFVPIGVAVIVGVLGLAYQALKPPPAKKCGSPNGPAITSPRVKLSSGRHIAYREVGVSKEDANHKVIIVHGIDSSKDIILPISQELIEELKVYFLFFDRPGYGESDPDPSRTVKSEALEIQELADLLQIGPKFYVIGISMGAYPVWGCLKYIPQRLAGVSLVVPFVHYWWPSFPSGLMKEAFMRFPAPDRRTVQVAYHAPWLLYWWVSQKWFTSLSLMAGDTRIFSTSDLELLKKTGGNLNLSPEKIRQQGLHESLNRDLLAGYSKWEFGPLELQNPISDGQCSVHIWHGFEDRMIPYQVNRYIAEKLPWIQYHEVQDKGHLMIFESHHCEAILRALLLQ